MSIVYEASSPHYCRPPTWALGFPTMEPRSVWRCGTCGAYWRVTNSAYKFERTWVRASRWNRHVRADRKARRVRDGQERAR